MEEKINQIIATIKSQLGINLDEFIEEYEIASGGVKLSEKDAIKILKEKGFEDGEIYC